jgi:dipeptidyl aminopeptidase/acylaminoacyl peptidase
MLHGTADTDVPHAESVAIAALLTLHGVPNELVSLEGLEHGLDPGDSPDAQRAVAAAFDRAAEFVVEHVIG